MGSRNYSAIPYVVFSGVFLQWDGGLEFLNGQIIEKSSCKKL
ncbi:MAG: hypothetical protein WBA93_36160 [Microcoleaceae cyanobacterium]